MQGPKTPMAVCCRAPRGAHHHLRLMRPRVAARRPTSGASLRDQLDHDERARPWSRRSPWAFHGGTPTRSSPPSVALRPRVAARSPMNDPSLSAWRTGADAKRLSVFAGQCGSPPATSAGRRRDSARPLEPAWIDHFHRVKPGLARSSCQSP